MTAIVGSPNAPARIVFISTLLLLIVTGLYLPQFFSARYLLQQLHTAAFLGIVAAGAMLVILLGHIDLSVPWTMTVAATFSTAFVSAMGNGGIGELGVVLGLGIGAAMGLINGLGVAVLRIPSMIWTLAVDTIARGICVYYTGQYIVKSQPDSLMLWAGQGKLFDSVSMTVVLWGAISLIITVLLRRTLFGRYIYPVGTNETAAYLSGLPTRRVVVAAFVASGMCSALAGLTLAGYANQAYQNMGEPYLLPGIAAVVLGGTSIDGGRGRYSGTVAGVLLITLVGSILSVLQVPEAIRQIIYGLIILAMLSFYSRR
jgi:ribose transport system permease protein